MNVGEENGLIKLYDATNKKMQRVSQEAYNDAVNQSFNNRINLNGKEYSVQKSGNQQNIQLIDIMNSSNRKVVNQAELNMLKQQNQAAFNKYL